MRFGRKPKLTDHQQAEALKRMAPGESCRAIGKLLGRAPCHHRQAGLATEPAPDCDAVSHLAGVTDRMHGLLMERADALMGCTENSPEETELAALTDISEAYERQRWPLGKIPGLKG